ncbi:hypothetical protein [Kalamiella sp. sgz302252]|uniref:hypothetical protein n=1 Tax=Pantoea sp. sgz302252 TaxID=3341827 RepID=UPI0036D38D21
MDNVKERIALLESQTSQIQKDVAVLVERSKHAANQSSLDTLAEQAKGFASQAALDALAEKAKGFASQAALDTLVERSESFATKTDVSLLRSDLYKEIGLLHKEVGLVRSDLQKEIYASESRMNDKFDAINNKITWTLLLPALTAIVLWFVKVAILKV